MELEHSFSIPVPVEKAWPVLLDIRRIAPCMPGAAVDSVDGDDFTGTVKVKLGPINLTYKGQAKFVEKDEQAHKAVIDARGRDSRGNGTAAAKITAVLTGKGDSTECKVVTDLNITGKPAQFGRGVMVDVGNKLIGQFADCLAGKLAAEESDSTDDAPKPSDIPPNPEAADADSQAADASGAKPSDSTPSSDAKDAAASSDAKPAAAAAGVTAAGTAAAAGNGMGAATTAAGDQDKTPTTAIPAASAADRDADKAKAQSEKSSGLPGFADSADSAADKPTVTKPSQQPASDKPAGDKAPQQATADKPAGDKPQEVAQAASDKQAAASASGTKPSPTTAMQRSHEPEPIDLIELAGGTVAKKAAPVALGALAIGLIATYLLKKKR